MNRILSATFVLCCIMSMSAMKRKSESLVEPHRVNCTTVNFFDADTHEPIDTWQLSDEQLKQSSMLKGMAEAFKGQELPITLPSGSNKTDIAYLGSLLSNNDPEHEAQTLLSKDDIDRTQRMLNLVDFLGLEKAVEPFLNAYLGHMLHNPEIFLKASSPEQLACSQLNPDLVENLRRKLIHRLPKTFYPQQTIDVTQCQLKLTFDAKGLLAAGSLAKNICLFKPDSEGKYHHQQTFGKTTTLLACDSNTGRLAAWAPDNSLSGNPAWRIDVWSPDDSGTYRCLQTIPLYANSASFNHTTGTLAVGSYSNNIKLFKPTAQGEYQLAQTIDTSPMVFNDRLIFHPTTGILATMRLNEMMIKLYKPDDDGSYQPLQTLTLPYQIVFTNIAWHPTEALLGSQITLGSQIVLWILNVTTGNYEHWQTIGRIPKPVHNLHNLSFAFDTTGDTLVASCGKDIEIWNRNTKSRKYQQIETISMLDDITALAFNPINGVLAVGSASHNITLLVPNYVGLRNTTLAQALLLIIAQQKKLQGTPLDPNNYPHLAPLMATFQEEPHQSNEALQNLVKLLIHQGANSQRS